MKKKVQSYGATGYAVVRPRPTKTPIEQSFGLFTPSRKPIDFKQISRRISNLLNNIVGV